MRRRRKRMFVWLFAALCLVILFFPFIKVNYDDGATKSWNALTYSVVSGPESDESVELYVFPQNFRSIAGK